MMVEEFCVKLKDLDFNHAHRALAILWFLDSKSTDIVVSPGRLARLISNAGLGKPNSTELGAALQKTKHVLKVKDGFKIKPVSRADVAGWVGHLAKVEPKPIDQDNGFIPKEVWQETRGYIERVAEQVNGCYEHRMFDGAAVLIRRLIETLLIECYEKLGFQDYIKKDDRYFMLAAIVEDAIDNKRLSMLGRDVKSYLTKGKLMGDRSAHTRRYNAVKADLDGIRDDLRLTIDELINLADLRRKKTL